MIYKSEHITDLETGVIAAAEFRCGDQGDTVDLAERALAAGEVLARVCEDPMQTKVLTSLTADEGFFAIEEVCCPQGERVRVVIGDPHAARRKSDNQDPVVRQVLHKARQAMASKSGKALLRQRGEHLERSFCHVLDHGKHRRATWRGRKNLTKRQLAVAFTYNLSLLMRHLTGHVTAKKWLAVMGGIVLRAHSSASRAIAWHVTAWTRKFSQSHFIRHHIDPLRVSVRNVLSDSGTRRFSTGC